MARLPSADDLGGLPSIRTGRVTPRASTTGLVQSDRAAVRGVRNVAGSLAGIGVDLQQEKEQDDRARAEIAFQEFAWRERQDLDRLSRETQPGDVTDFATNWQTGYNERATDFMSNNVPKSQAERYTLKLLSTRNGLFSQAQTFERGENQRVSRNNFATLGDRISASAAATSTAELDRHISGLEEALEADNKLTPIQKDVVRREEYRKIASAHFAGLSPSQRLGLVGQVRGHRTEKNPLAKFESGGNYSALNNLGFAGKYQFGAPRLQELGLYSPGKGELSNWNKKFVTDPSKWSGSFRIPGFKKIRTVEDFLASPEAQEAVYKKHIADIDRFASKNNLYKDFIGQNIGGTVLTKDSIRYMAHLGGKEGAKRYLQSGGAANPADANGTRLSTYASLGAGRTTGGPSAVLATLDDSDLTKIESQAKRDFIKQQNEAEKANNEAKKQRIDDLQFRIHDGSAGEDELNEARARGDFKDFEDFNRTKKLLDSVQEENRILSRFNSVLAGKGTIDPSDTDDKKMLNTYFDKVIGREKIAAKDQGAVDELVGLVDAVEATPKDAVGLLTAMSTSADDKTAIFALQALNRIRQTNPDSFVRDFDSNAVRRAEIFASQAEFTTEQKLLDRIRETESPMEAKARQTFVRQADKNNKDLTADAVIEGLDLDTFFEFSDPEPAFGPGQTAEGIKGVLLEEYKALYREEFARTGGDAEAAESIALNQLKRSWGASRVTGDARLMKHAPENYFKPVSGSYDWMQKQLKEEVRNRISPMIGSAKEGLFGTIFDSVDLPDMMLVPVPRFNPQKPMWNVAIIKDDVVDFVRTRDGSVLPYTFDPKPFRDKERRNFEQARRRALKNLQEKEQLEDSVFFEASP